MKHLPKYAMINYYIKPGDFEYCFYEKPIVNSSNLARNFFNCYFLSQLLICFIIYIEVEVEVRLIL